MQESTIQLTCVHVDAEANLLEALEAATAAHGAECWFEEDEKFIDAKKSSRFVHVNPLNI